MEDVLGRIVAWAEAEPSVLALVLTGSRAALGGRPDEWSDLDVEVICDDPSALAADDAWPGTFGEVLVVVPLVAGDGDHATRLVIYPEGEVDFSLCGRDRIDGQAGGLTDLYRRGYRVLHDPGGITEVLPEPDGHHHPVPGPAAAEVERAVSVFWLEMHHLPGYLARGELWAAKFRDGTIKRYLRRMLEWRALLADPGADVRHIGRGMRGWVGEEEWAALHGVWGGFDAADAVRAALATIDVFGRVAREVCAAVGVAYPAEVERLVTGRLRGLGAG
ncbi:MAG: aminoglycoside 6-adenylyltransferase [Actinobacteria bacterium]|nr:aminoglycoside 6-adenylyltransferase [Actinomycetota bacterium]